MASFLIPASSPEFIGYTHTHERGVMSLFPAENLTVFYTGENRKQNSPSPWKRNGSRGFPLRDVLIDSDLL